MYFSCSFAPKSVLAFMPRYKNFRTKMTYRPACFAAGKKGKHLNAKTVLSHWNVSSLGIEQSYHSNKMVLVCRKPLGQQPTNPLSPKWATVSSSVMTLGNISCWALPPAGLSPCLCAILIRRWTLHSAVSQSVRFVFHVGTTHVRIPSATAAPRFPVSNDYCLVIDSSHGVCLSGRRYDFVQCTTCMCM